MSSCKTQLILSLSQIVFSGSAVRKAENGPPPEAFLFLLSLCHQQQQAPYQVNKEGGSPMW